MAMTTTPPSGEPEAHGSAGRKGGRRGRDGRLRRGMGRRTSRLAVGVVAAAVVLTVAAVALAQGFGTFRDVPDNYWARDSVQWAVQNGITVGCRDGYFCPEQTLNRAYAVTFLHRYHKYVIGSLENRVRTLEGRTTTTPTTTRPGGFTDPTATTTTLSPRDRRVSTGRVAHTSGKTAPTVKDGDYTATFALEATKPALNYYDPDTSTDDDDYDITRLRLEYRAPGLSTWHPVDIDLEFAGDPNQGSNQNVCTGSEINKDRLPHGDCLVSTTDVEITIGDAVGEVPQRSTFRVTARAGNLTTNTHPAMDLDTIRVNRNGTDTASRKDDYEFFWSLVLEPKD